MIEWWWVILFFVVGGVIGWQVHGTVMERRQWHEEDKKWMD